MATSKQYSEYILHVLGDGFSIKSMFGEYCLYYMGKTVAFVCDDRLLIKPTKQSAHLDKICEMQEAYPGSKLYYLVTDDQLSEPRGFIETMHAIAAATPDKKPRKPKPNI
ncbi:TfoX/Sxy family protein [Pseudaquidulcibacter saccharophilus]|uniref:TfoX/Sxy family protein n=1 Tax=Pseudaquidulcibacter saccharophilus TaxID=2831900 RepID=UPI003083F08B